MADRFEESKRKGLGRAPGYLIGISNSVCPKQNTLLSPLKWLLLLYSLSRYIRFIQYLTKKSNSFLILPSHDPPISIH